MTGGDGDYGEGKTREQEAHDSVVMLGVAAVLAVVVFAVAAAALGWWLL